MANPLIVSGLYYYPIKSCAGISTDHAEIDARGVKHDREFMVIDAQTHNFVTQRQRPRMALIRPRIYEGVLEVEAPAMSRLVNSIRSDGQTIDVIVHKDTCVAIDQGDAIAAWLGEFLMGQYRLVRMADSFSRKVDPAYAKRERDQVSFADAYPFLLISEESLSDLNARLREPLPMDRFRPNIVIHGGSPYIEDRFKRIKIGETVFDIVKPCARCVITTTNQATAERGKEPLATLATYRKVGNDVLFGQNLLHETGGTLRKGSLVEVLQYKD